MKMRSRRPLAERTLGAVLRGSEGLNAMKFDTPATTNPIDQPEGGGPADRPDRGAS
jgi:hypothetical protein